MVEWTEYSEQVISCTVLARVDAPPRSMNEPFDIQCGQTPQLLKFSVGFLRELIDWICAIYQDKKDGRNSILM